MTSLNNRLLAQTKELLVKELLGELRRLRETVWIQNLEFYRDRSYEVVAFGAKRGIFDTKDILFWQEEIKSVFDDRTLTLPYLETINDTV